MKYVLLIPLAACVLALNSYSQDRIYRCGNEYTNTLPDAKAKAKDCKLISGGNVTVVPGTRPAARALASAVAGSAAQRVNAGEQKARDSDVRQILEAELKKAQARQTDLLKEYNNGAPEKQGNESRNYQKYLDRVAELKASLARNESDIAGLRRELGRLGNSAALAPPK